MSCRCGVRFMDAEDYRDHLPCPGSSDEQRGRAEERAAVVADLRSLLDGYDPKDYGDSCARDALRKAAARYERGEHLGKEGT